MTKVFCLVEERFVNPLFEVFDGGDLILSSYRDIEQPRAEMRIFTENPEQVAAARTALEQALEVIGESSEIAEAEIPDEDWKFAYRRHFKTELVSPRILVQPDWEDVAVIRFDPGMAFGTGKHETTKACLQYIDELAPRGDFQSPIDDFPVSQASNPDLQSSILKPLSSNSRPSFLDMGCGSGILSSAAAKLGFGPVAGFDVDQEAVDASIENAEKNGVKIDFYKFALGRVGQSVSPVGPADLVAANILGPLLIRFADEIVPYVKKHLIVSGILTELYPEVLAAYEARGFKELSHKTIGEWTTGLLFKG